MSEIKIKEVMEEIYHKLQDGDTRLSEEQTETYRVRRNGNRLLA